jgi:hypothetical protein
MSAHRRRFIKAKSINNTVYQLVNTFNKMYIQTMEYYSAIKRSRLVRDHTTTWVIFRNVLKKRSLMQKIACDSYVRQLS